MIWIYSHELVDWYELTRLYQSTMLADVKADDWRTAYSNSMFKCFVYDNDKLIGAGRALADGYDCSYLCSIVVHPEYQGRGLGKAITNKLKEMSAGHRKIILFASPGKDGFYRKLGFLPMLTAMAVFRNQERAIKVGFVAND
jgi:ribosomal protein S18 acetylase RimI-like enzyme